jgi:hypothetical protein
MGRAGEPTQASRIEASAILVKKRGRGIEEGSGHRRSWFSSMSLARAGPEPLLRSNAKFQLQGQETAKHEVIMCQQKAEAAG